MEHVNIVTVVIRSVHERTEQLCKKLIIEQGVPESQVHIIHETPFSKAMKASYSLGINKNLKWTLCIDADVLLCPGSIDRIIDAADRAPDNFMVFSGKVLDKLFGDRRRAGNHLFRTSGLSRLLSQIPDYTDETVRPESSVINQLEKQGYFWKKTDILMGLHDFEQHYHDLSRKCFVHARKHTEYVSELVEYWSVKKQYDQDFTAALIGLSEGILHSGEVKINVENFQSLSRLTEKELGKKSVDPSDFSIHTGSDVDSVLQNPGHQIQISDNIKNRYLSIYKNRFKKDEYLNILSMLLNKIIGDFKSLFKP